MVAYDAGPPKEAYVQRMAYGDTLIDMPLFLAPGWYVDVPLEQTYQAASRACPGVSASVSRLPLAKFEHRMRTSPGPPQELN